MNKIKEIEKTADRKNAIYRASEYTYSLKNFQTTKTFGRDIYDGKTTLKEADNGQSNLSVEIMNFKKNTKPQEDKERVLIAFESIIFPIKTEGLGYLDSKHPNLKILTPKQMLQRLPIALAQIKASNNSESSGRVFILSINKKKLLKSV